MLKSELISRLADRNPKIKDFLVKKAAEDIINRMIEALLEENGRIELRGFGSLTCRYYGPRKAHNPRSGQFIMAGPCVKPHFKAGRILKARLVHAKHSHAEQAPVLNDYSNNPYTYEQEAAN
jgi:integration host factor subunit beta